MELQEYLSKGLRERFENVRPLQHILVKRMARDGHERVYVGKCKQLRKPNAYVIDMFAEVYFEDGIKSSKFKPKDMSFRNSSDITVLLLEDASSDAKQRLAEERRAYARARRQLQQQRKVSNDAFSLLGIDDSISMEDFKSLRKRVMLQWHPDRAAASCKTQTEMDTFLEKSKQYTDALSWVAEYLKVKFNRVTK